MQVPHVKGPMQVPMAILGEAPSLMATTTLNMNYLQFSFLGRKHPVLVQEGGRAQVQPPTLPKYYYLRRQQRQQCQGSTILPN